MILVYPDRLLVTSGTATSLDVHVGYEEADGDFRHGRQNTGFSTAVTIEVLSLAPNTPRKVLDFNIHNKGTVSSTVTVEIYDGSTSIVLWSDTIGAGQRLTYLDGIGFVAPATPKLDLMKYVTADFINPLAATYATITGLSFPVVGAKIYTFELQLFHVANATTNGALFAVSGVTATFLTVGSMSVVVAGVATTTMSSGVVTAVDTAVIAQTTSSTAATVPTFITGSIQPAASGTLVFQGTGEDANAAALTVKKGSFAHLREVDN